MSVKGFTVTFQEDVSEEYMEQVKNAVLCFKGVIDVEESTATPEDQINRSRLKWEMWDKIQKVILEK
jgi:hypothetical protein